METPSPIPKGLPPEKPPGTGMNARPVQLAVAFILGVAIAWVGGRALHTADARPTLHERVVSSIDLNQATKTDLLQLPGIGDALADAILTTRDQNGGFRTIDELRQVRGIGPTRLENLRPYLRIDSPTVPVSTPIHVTKKPGTADIKASADRAATKKSPPTSPIDLNRASAEELQQIPGVGPVLSQRIIAARDQKPFRNVDDLRRVSGIGVKTLEKLRPMVMVGEPPANGADASGIP